MPSPIGEGIAFVLASGKEMYYNGQQGPERETGRDST